jgi:hypothetical protein
MSDSLQREVTGLRSKMRGYVFQTTVEW